MHENRISVIKYKIVLHRQQNTKQIIIICISNSSSWSRLANFAIPERHRHKCPVRRCANLQTLHRVCSTITRLTYSYLIDHTDPPECNDCHQLLSVKHILTECSLVITYRHSMILQHIRKDKLKKLCANVYMQFRTIE